MYGLRPTTQPATSVVSVSEQKSHMRLLGRDAADADVLAYLLFAEEYLTSVTNHAFQMRSYRFTIDRPPAQYGYRWVYQYMYNTNQIELPLGPLQSVQQVSYKALDATNGLQTIVIPATTYQVVTNQVPGRIMPYGGGFWPFGSVFALEGMTVDFTAGYGAGTVPHTARMAIKMLAAFQYENREPLINANVVGDIPVSLKHLIDNLRTCGFA